MHADPSALAGPDVGFADLTTERLTIRRFCDDDAESLAAYRSDPDVARYQGWDVPYTRERAGRFIAELAGTHPDTPGEWFQFAIIETISGAHVGDVAAHVDGDDPRLARIGVTLARAAQGEGYASEALTALLDYLFVTRGKYRVAADCDPRNAPSVAVLERLGMRREAHHVSSAWWRGEWTDEYVYALLRSEWVSRRSEETNQDSGSDGCSPARRSR